MRLGTFVAILLALVGAPAFGAIPILDTTVTYSSSGAPASSYTWSHTTGAIANAELIVQGGFSTGTVSGVSANGMAMTLIAGSTTLNPIYAIAAAASTTYTVVFTFTFPSSLKAASISFGNVRTSPFSAASTASSSSSPLSATVTSDSNSIVLAMTSGTATFTASQTLLWGGASHCAEYAAGSATTSVGFTFIGGFGSQTMSYVSMEGTPITALSGSFFY